MTDTKTSIPATPGSDAEWCGGFIRNCRSHTPDRSSSARVVRSIVTTDATGS